MIDKYNLYDVIQNKIYIYEKPYNNYISQRYAVVNNKIIATFVHLDETMYITQEILDELQIALNRVEGDAEKWKKDSNNY